MFGNDLGSAWDIAEGRSIPTLKFEFQDQYGNRTAAAPGTEYILQTTEDLDVVQQRNFETQELEFWDDGRPKKNIVVTGTLIATNVAPEQYGVGDDDDLVRRFFFKGQSQRALQEEIKAKKLNRFGIGTKIRIVLNGFQPPKAGRGFPMKIYGVEIIDPTPYVAPEQQQVEQTLASSQAAPVHQQAQTNFAPAQVPAASAAPAQVAAQPAQVQQAAQPAPVAAPSQPAAQAVAQPAQPAAPVAQQIAQAPIPAAAAPAEVAQPAAPAQAGPNPAEIKAEYDKVTGVGVDHDLAVVSLATKYGVDRTVIESSIAI